MTDVIGLSNAKFAKWLTRRQVMTVECCVCGKLFETNRKDRKTCGDVDCKSIYHTKYLQEYAAEKQKIKNERNRKWMREYREQQRAEKQARLEAINSFEAEGYAERQMKRSLELAGKIEVPKCKKGETIMWIRLGNRGVQIKENQVDSIWLEEEKRKGRGQRDWLLKSREDLTGYEQELFRFENYDEASIALVKIVEALDERRSRLEL